MVMYVQGRDISAVHVPEFKHVYAGIYSFYPSWPDTDLFAREVRKVVLADVMDIERASWDSTLKVLEEIVQTLCSSRRWQVEEVVSGKHVASDETASSDQGVLQGFQNRFGPFQGFEGLISEESPLGPGCR